MLTNQWYVICTSKELKSQKLQSLVRLGQKLVLWRDSSGKVVCMNDQCCHRGMALSAGRIVNDCIECSYHGFQYNYQGNCQYIPANGKDASIPKGFYVLVYPTYEAYGFIWMWSGEKQENLPPIPWFSELNGCHQYISQPITIAAHYTRVIENLLDIAHLPIAHAKSFGSVMAPTIDNMECMEWDGKRLKIRSSIRFKKGSRNKYIDVIGRDDDGTPPKETLPPPWDYSQEPFDAQFMFPGIWRVCFNVNFFGRILKDKFYSMVTICPIDEETCLIYIANYQRVVNLPIIKNLICYLANIYDHKVGFYEDRITVENQYPQKSYLGINEKLIAADRSILFYRQHIQKLREEAGFQPIQNGEEFKSINNENGGKIRIFKKNILSY
jgi:phenylpropionate dioxygenase-like ring-hydroxylating dioxygenase large terminal subunit